MLGTYTEQIVSLEAIDRFLVEIARDGETETKMKIQNVENLLCVEFVYHFHLFAVPLKKTIQR